MKYSKAALQKIVEKALDELYIRDSLLLSKNYDIHERTITHRLAMYLEPYFNCRSYNVDVEYNRMREKYGDGDVGELLGKTIKWEESDEGTHFVYPDIIVHKRDTDDNLIEIEVKMSWKNSKKQFDYLKINEYMSKLHYQFGIYIELSETRENCRIEYAPFELKK